MPDPIDELENFTTPGLTMNPLPAAEVRRRGTRMRRRNNALATIGGVAAVAIIATPIALAATGNPREANPTPPIASPPAGWVTTIPAGFDLGAVPSGAQFSFEVRDDAVVDDLRLCDDLAFSTDGSGATDTAGASYGEPDSDGGNGRTLAVYADERAAQAALDDLRQGVEDCPEQERTDGQTDVNDVRDVAVPGAEDALVYTTQVRGTDGLMYDMTSFEVARVGNALYLGTSFGTLGGEQALVNVDNLIATSAPVIDQMCTFSVEGCDPDTTASEAVDEPAGLTGAIADDFPLAEGLPTDAQGGVGLEGPSHDLDLEVYNVENSLQACGVSPAGLPQATDTLYAGFRSASTGILRQLMTFGSDADAQAWVDGVTAVFTDCPEYDDGSGATKVYEVVPEQAGDAAASVVGRTEIEGEPGPGVQVVQLVRVGQAVLFTLVNDEETQLGTATTPDEVRATYLDDSRSVIDAMG